MSRSIIIVIYYVVLVIAIGMSSYFSFMGFLPTLGSWALVVPFTTIIALGLFAAGTLVQIGRDRKSIKEQMLAVLLFSVFALFSTSSNFTYLYTNMRAVIEREDAIEEERDRFETAVKSLQTYTSVAVDANRTFMQDLANWYGRSVVKNLTASLETLDTSPEYSSFTASLTQLNSELENMFEQANDPIRPSCAARCRAHIDTINGIVTELTDTGLTDIVVPTEVVKFNQFVPRYEKMVWTSICNENANFISLYNLSTGTMPSSYCTPASDQVSVNQIVEFITRLEKYNVDSVSEFLVALSEKIIAVNLIYSSAPMSSLASIQLTNIPTTIDTAAALYVEQSKKDSFGENYSSELVQQKEQVLADLQKALDTSNVSQPLLLDDTNCSPDVISVNPRNCLQKMSSVLNRLTGDFKNLFPNQDLPDAASGNEINIENGQIGTIKDTIYNGFVELPSLPTTVFAFFMGLMIDVLPLIFAFVAFHGYVRPEVEKDIWEINA